MVAMLFRRGSAQKWFVVGFSAWLAGLAGEGGYKLGGSSGNEGDRGYDGWGSAFGGVREGWEWFQSNEVMAGVIFGAVLFALALAVLVLWISSRGKFIFLDNVLEDRATIAEPWKRYRRLGNSLFLFRLIATLLCVPLALGFIGLFIYLAAGPGGWAHLEGAASVGGLVATAISAAALVLVGLYLYFFLDAFVVPLMHRHDLGAMAAWGRFFTLFRQRPWWFLACGLLVFVLCMVVASAVFMTGLMTCCLGFLLLAIPYIGTVVLLPVLITYRAFTVEFLAQLEPELLESG